MSELAANYAAAGFGGALPPGERPALLIVDFAMAYLEPTSPLYAGVEAVREACIALVATARATRTPIVWTRVRFTPGGREGGLFYRRLPPLACFDEGNPLGDFDPRLAPATGDMVVTKYYPSAFFGTALAPMLNAMRIDTLLVTGLSTSGCVRASALDALCHGFAPFVVRDCVGDRHPAVHEANLFDLQAKYADVIALDAAEAMLRR